MATLPSFVSFSYHKPFLNHKHEQEYPPPKRNFATCACSIKKPRGSRKVKKNVELCNDLREFVSTVGLPEGHVPSFKELQDHGRNDLANIVRRRGYKLIRDLLSNSTESDSDELPKMAKNLAKGPDAINHSSDRATEGQDEKVKDSSFSTKGPVIKNHSENIDFDPENKFCEQQGEEVLSMVKQFSLSAEVSNADSNFGVLNVYPDLNSDDNTSMPVETSANLSLEEKVKYDSGQDEKFSFGAEEMPLSRGVSVTQNYPSVKNIPGLVDGNYGCMSANSSLEEKFIRNGELDAIEDNVYGLSNGSGSGESKGIREPENIIKVDSNISSEENFENANGSLSTSMQVLPSLTAIHAIRNESPAEGLAGADVDQDLNVETSKKDNHIEINHLKSMLHHKELELSQLKEQIEKEKLVLSALQTKAERELSKAQKLISEKDAELLAAEESLSGLVEVEIQYCGNGELVEVAGSFNGWHHRIRLDPQPSSSIIDHFGSRKSRLWSAMLWLYPGVYEIKFIVDGHWRVDPQMESITKGGICNNILQVDR